MIEQFQSDNSTDILYKNPSDVKWIPYNKLHFANYTRVHYDSTSDVMVMRVNSEVNTLYLSHSAPMAFGQVELGGSQS